jgi:hypothetical protein
LVGLVKFKGGKARGTLIIFASNTSRAILKAGSASLI